MNSILISNEMAKQICKSGYRYLYGGKDQLYTKALVNSLAKAYPNVFTTSLKAEAMKDADKGYRAIDCSGFVCKVMGIANQGSAQLRKNAVKRFKITKENAMPGMAIWRDGHIAYIGEGLKIYEAASTKTDMKVSEFEDRAGAFTELLVIKDSYLATNYDNLTRKKNPYTEPTVTIKKGCKDKDKGGTIENNGVRWVQYELIEAGCKGADGKELAIDGSFGANSEYALKAFQASCKIAVDGKCGPTTRKYLKNN